jgi:mannose-6-phosphate isomerase-like protein (cupin superfamily)
MKVNKPWGYYQVLFETEKYKVKELCVFPGGRLSLQKHFYRNEHWFVVEGRALVQVDAYKTELYAGSYVDIPAGSCHRLANNKAENLILIEIQTGRYFGEDDITRAKDDYDRL